MDSSTSREPRPRRIRLALVSCALPARQRHARSSFRCHPEPRRAHHRLGPCRRRSTTRMIRSRQKSPIRHPPQDTTRVRYRGSKKTRRQAVSCSDSDDAAPPEPSASTEPSAAVTPRGIDLATITVIPAVGEARKLHMWVADTPTEHGLGLTGITDLGGGEGMLFIFEDVGIRPFYMWQTPMPLSVAFFDDGGQFVDSADWRRASNRPSPTASATRPTSRFSPPSSSPSLTSTTSESPRAAVSLPDTPVVPECG
jgi:uncharacterized membrane protein (UPF0127 family)